jgi:hypothetical protein
VLSVADSERAVHFDAFLQGLRDLGYVEGRNIVLEFRLARGNLSLGPQLAAELVALPVDIIVVEGLTPNAVARRADVTEDHAQRTGNPRNVGEDVWLDK